MLLPYCGHRMRPVTSSLIADRNQNVTPSRYPLDLTLQDPKLGRIDLIIGGVYREQWSSDFFEVWLRIIVSRGVELIEHIVGIVASDVRLNQPVEHLVGLVASGGLLLPLKR